jgi:hypothetical protein
MFALAVAAAFCIVAFASVISDSSDAAANGNTYEVYVEVIDAKGHVTSTSYVYFDCDSSDLQKFADAANDAFDKSDVKGLKMKVSEYGIGIEYNGSTNNACYYSDGKDWQAVSDGAKDYTGHHKLGLAVGTGYISEGVYEDLTDLEKADWEETGYGDPYAYMKILEVSGAFDKIVEFKVNMTIISDDLVTATSMKDPLKFVCETNDLDAFVYAFNKATADLGNSEFSDAKVANILGVLIFGFKDSIKNAVYVDKDGKWVKADDKGIVSGADLDLELKNGLIDAKDYNKLSDSEKKCWQSSGATGGMEWMRIPGATPGSSSGGVPVLYIVIAVIAIAVIAGAAYYLVKNKKAGSA